MDSGLASVLTQQFYREQGPEFVGFIIGSKIIQVPNISPEPDTSFMVSVKDIISYADEADYFFHTHPNQDSNLSHEDFIGIKNWPSLTHCIIGNDGVSCYKYNEEREEVTKVYG